MCMETTLHMYRNDLDLYQNDFVSKQPDTIGFIAQLHAEHFTSAAEVMGLDPIQA